MQKCFSSIIEPVLVIKFGQIQFIQIARFDNKVDMIPTINAQLGYDMERQHFEEEMKT